jgi:hypothetical protein
VAKSKGGKLMTHEEFGRGLQLINSVCTKQIDTDDTIETYYLLLKDLNKEDYLTAILDLLKTKENIYNPISPAEIRNKVSEKSKYIASQIFDQIKLDIIRYAETPKYNPEIELVLQDIGGIGKIKMANEKELSYIERDFLKIMNDRGILSKNKSIENKPKYLKKR